MDKPKYRTIGKNCHLCANLEWFEGGVYEESGWTCNGRDYTSSEQEAKHLSQLESADYRYKGKRCFESFVNP